MNNSSSKRSIERMGEERVLYSNTLLDSEIPPQKVEEISLRWEDGSVSIIQMRRPRGWQADNPLDKSQYYPNQAEEFYMAVQEMLHDLFNGHESARIKAGIDPEG